jgi:hypothetical protein
MEIKCLLYVVTWWGVSRAGLLVSSLLPAFLHSFFIFTQSEKTSGDTVEMHPTGLHFEMCAFPKVSPLFFKDCQEGLQYSLGISQRVTFTY